MINRRCKIGSVILMLMCCSSYFLYAQTDKSLIKEGNTDYKKKNYPEAETKYRKSLQTNPQSATASYTLGNALYKQGKEAEAEQYYSGSAAMDKDKEAQADAYYNLGNAKLKAQKYQESVDAYKQALKLNDKNEDARYNLAYALSKLRQQQQQQQQQKDNKDQKKDNQQQKKDQQQQQQDQKKQQEQEQQQQQVQKKEKISKEDAERMLQALKNDEKKLQKKLSKKYEATMGNADKDW
ncbi:MAG: tetratricopeptide repeat protein [Bacteroidota bacterium]